MHEGPINLWLSAVDTGRLAATNAKLYQCRWRRDMGLLGVLGSLNVDNLSDAEKKKLKGALQEHKKTLTKVGRLVDGHLRKLSKKKKKKKKKS
jgi:hypothetical protein